MSAHRKGSWFTITTFARISLKRYFRDKTAIFFTIFFPIIFLVIFGGIFGRQSNVSFNVGLVNQSQTQFSHQFVDLVHKNSKVYKLNDKIHSLDDSKLRMSRGEADATLILPPDFGKITNGQPRGDVVIYYNPSNEQTVQTLRQVIQGTVDGINAKLVKTDTPFKVVTKSTNTTGLSRFDYVFSGLLGFSILSLGIFGPTNVFPELKKQGILRRIHITPIKVWQYFVSNVLASAAIGLLSLTIMFAVALTFFHLKMHGDYFELAVLVVFGILTIYGIGLAIGGWAKDINQAAPLSNLVSFPMMFLSGTFFPRFLMPEWLQHASGLLPLTPVIDSIRLIITENKHLWELGPQIGLIALWAVIIYAIAFRAFRWE